MKSSQLHKHDIKAELDNRRALKFVGISFFVVGTALLALLFLSSGTVLPHSHSMINSSRPNHVKIGGHTINTPFLARYLSSYILQQEPSQPRIQTFVPRLGADAVRLLQGMCRHSAYPSTCMHELSPLTAQAASASPSDIVSLSLQAAKSRADEALQLATNCSTSLQLSLLESQCADDCVYLVGRTKDLLTTVVSMLSQLQFRETTVVQSSLLRDVKVHLSTAMSYQAACIDGFDALNDDQLELVQTSDSTIAQQQLLKNQDYLSQVIGNVLSLVDLLARDIAHTATTTIHDEIDREIIDEDRYPAMTTNKVAARRLLLEPAQHAIVAPLVSGDDNDDDRLNYGWRTRMMEALLSRNDDTVDGFPEWVSPADRRLLLEAAATPPPTTSPDDTILPPSPAPTPNIILANVVVAQDGSGDFLNITSALNSIPRNVPGRFVVYIKAGEYNEIFNVTQDQTNVTFVGDGIGLTIITGSRNVASGLFNTFRTSTVGISGDGFFARDITFRNTAGPRGHQAVALRAGADKVIFYRCSFEGFQDTLYALSGLQFYRECEISGTVDFIFGNAIAVFQNCKLLARLPMHGQSNTYTAQGRRQATDVNGFTFHNCTVTGAAELLNATLPVSTYLGRPWKAFSRVVFMQSQMEALVEPQGWLPWNQSNPFSTTLFYGEFQNRGPGSSIESRVDWQGVHANLSFDEANAFTVQNFIDGNTWLPNVLTPIDFFPTLFKSTNLQRTK